MGESDTQGLLLRTEFAQVQGELLQPVLREESFVERIFRRTPVSEESMRFPIRSRKVRSGWYATGNDSVPMRTAEQKETFINTFWLDAGARWPLDYLKAGNASLIDDLLEDMVDDLGYKINLQGMSLIKWAEQVTHSRISRPLTRSR